MIQEVSYGQSDHVEALLQTQIAENRLQIFEFHVS